MTLDEMVNDYEYRLILEAYKKHDFNQSHTAKALGISRRTLIYKLEKHGLKEPPDEEGRSRSDAARRRRAQIAVEMMFNEREAKP